VPERIQKVLASAGIGSRREIERWIRAGRLIVDGRPAIVGERVTGHEKFVFDGRRLEVDVTMTQTLPTVLAYYKPAGEITTRDDPEGRPTVFDDLPQPRRGRWVTVGRLDINTSGLLLFTTSGELAHRLMHPSYSIPRYYAVRVLGELEPSDLERLRQGVLLDDRVGRFSHIQFTGGRGTNVWYDVSVNEGRNREVRRLFEAVGATVSRLIRTRYGPIELGKLRRGQWRFLDPRESAALFRAVDLRPDRD
jgi:23S rRNA pseudouridine2605 synthase